MQKAKKFKELVLLKTKSHRNFSILDFFITANNHQEAGSIHLQSKLHKMCVTCIKCFIEQFPALLSLYIIANNSHCPSGTKCAVKIKELLRNFWYYNLINRGPKIRNQALSQVLYKKIVYNIIIDRYFELAYSLEPELYVSSKYRLNIILQV